MKLSAVPLLGAALLIAAAPPASASFLDALKSAGQKLQQLAPNQGSNPQQTRPPRHPAAQPQAQSVGVLLVTVGSSALDRSATDATHDFLVKADQARKSQEAQAASANTPSL